VLPVSQRPAEWRAKLLVDSSWRVTLNPRNPGSNVVLCRGLFCEKVGRQDRNRPGRRAAPGGRSLIVGYERLHGKPWAMARAARYTGGERRPADLPQDQGCPMERFLTVAGGQLGPIARNESRQQVVSRLLELMREAKARGSDVVVFPELALTTFFPRWWMVDEAEVDSFFEREMPSPATRPLFETAKSLGIGFYLGYAELAKQNGATRRFNTAILVDKNADIVGKYRKVHLPGHADDRSHYPFQHLEKRYFEPGDLGFPVWRAFGANVGMCICNDRRWPETYRVMGMQSVELILLGYNTPTHLPWVPVYDHLAGFHNHLCMQAGAYQNSTWVVGVAKAGNEEGSELLAGSCIISPSGEIVAQATGNGDEVFIGKCNLDISRFNKEAMFNFAQHRRIEHYRLITERTGAVPPQ
jgi:predicted amidohydrolase